jgi:cyclopropane fatty-acyl-phospholipid synthase-like methyltransferase
MTTSATSTRDAPVDEVGEFYDDVAWLTDILGGNIHVGYWRDDDDRTPLLEAINRFTDIIGDKLGLRAGEHLLDVGCGAGVPAIRLGQRTDARITAITNSDWHLGEASRRVKAAGLRGQVRIEHGDAAALSYPDGTFDAVLALESLPHAADRGQWVREMLRVLRPGGRAVLTDLTQEVPLTEEECEILQSYTLATPLPALDFMELVRRSGFQIVEFVNCSAHTKRSHGAYYERVVQWRTELAATQGAETVDALLEGMLPINAIFQGKLGYAIVVGRKPV